MPKKRHVTITCNMSKSFLWLKTMLDFNEIDKKIKENKKRQEKEDNILKE